LPQRKVWHLLVAGGLWIVLGVILQFGVFVPSHRLIRVGNIVIEVDGGVISYLWNSVVGVVHATWIALIVPCALGVHRWWLAIRVLRVRDLAPAPAGDEAIEAARRERPLARVLPTPPRLGNDPFRDPPRPPAIVPEGSGHPPKILT
jgi:hypothetical protein